MSGVRFVFPKPRLAEILRMPGGLPVVEALERAQGNLETLKPSCLAELQARVRALLRRTNNNAAAADSFNGAYKLDPGNPATLAALGRLALRENDMEKARKFYRSLLLQNFDEKTAGVSKAEVYLMLGRMHVLANEIPKARNMFERGLEVDPGNVDLKAAIAGLG